MYLTDTRVSFSSDCKRITHVQTLILIALYSSKVSSGSALALSAKARAIKPLLWPLTFLLHPCSSIKLTARRVSHTFAPKTAQSRYSAPVSSRCMSPYPRNLQPIRNSLDRWWQHQRDAGPAQDASVQTLTHICQISSKHSRTTEKCTHKPDLWT